MKKPSLAGSGPAERRDAILDHAVDEPSALTAASLMADVRRAGRIPEGKLPRVCILEFDGDLTDWLVLQGIAKPFAAWPCFHTAMFTMELEGESFGIIARTIGGPYAVLIAEQLHAAGVELIVGLTSAGRLAEDLPLPCLVVATGAFRDEGTSYHYLPPAEEVKCPTPIIAALERELRSTGWTVRAGKVWTTDAPYRETHSQLRKWTDAGAAAVEMQTASLYAFATARHAAVVCVAMVSNAVNHQGEQFDTGSQEDGLRILEGIARAARSFRRTA